ncbi:MAG: preprotein translocase subunit SecY [Deltaproteobacteria bacterium]|nr:preprotein translocase subunit SecY [Deltaproteobacteria bacterium]
MAGNADKSSSGLVKKLFWTFLLLIFYRVGVHVPIPGIDTAALADYFKELEGTLFALLDMFSGGSLSRLSIFALGVMPYISSSIIMQLLQVVSPDLKRLAKEEGAAGRKKVTQYTRYGTVLISLIQGLAMAKVAMGMTSPVNGLRVVLDPSTTFMLVSTLTVTAGTILVMWIGERITEKGIGNGISLIIFAGIVANIPAGIYRMFERVSSNEMSLIAGLVIAVFMAAVLIFIVFMERGQRRIPIHYAKRQMGRKMFGGQTTHLPLRVNTSGVIPPIFASSLLMFPATIAQVSTSELLRSISDWFNINGLAYNIIYVALIVFFCFFYTAIIFDTKDISENLKKQGGFVPGIRPGEKTQQYIDKVLTRITVWGATYISCICVLPQILISEFNIPFYYGGTSLLIVVGVAMDFMSQVESHLISRQYESLMGKTRIKGRNG